MHRRFFLVSALALAGCATTPEPRTAASPPAALAELEPVFRADASREALTIRVSSNGCTRKEDFSTFVERRAEGGATLAFGRKRLDTCKSFAAGHVDLMFSWAELGVDPGTPLFLLNPLSAWRGP